jgi:hypothetical protein
MTLDEYNSLRSIKATLENAFAQDTLFWMKETLASGLMSLDCLVNAGKKQHAQMDTTGMLPCPDCNPTGVFNYSPRRGCQCEGKAWVHNDLNSGAARGPIAGGPLE